MIQFGLRLLRRFAVLLPGVVIAYFSVREVFPFFDKRLPISVSVLITYILGAYVLIPAVIRVLRIFHPAKHLPLYCVTPDGFASDPLNIGIICRRQELITAMEQAGWFMADPHKPGFIIKHAVSIVLGRIYPTAPVSNLYLFGRKQDLAFEIPVSTSAGTRHHVRFWATTYENKKRLSVRSISWHNRRAHVRDDKLLWVGAASLDVGFAPIRHNFQLTHMIHPDTNSERELIVSQLKSVKLVDKIEKIKLGNPYKLVNRAWRGYLQTDGKMTVVTLKKPRKPTFVD